MKRCIPFLALLILSVTALAGPDERVVEIRKWYNTVQKAKPTAERKIAFESDVEPLLGDVTIREYDDGWKTVVASYGAGDHAMIDEHFYFKEGKLFFTYVVTTYWRFHPESTDEKPKTIDTRTEDRYYFEDGKCIRCLTRTATSEKGDKLAEIVGKLEQKQVDLAKDPDKDWKADAKRAGKMLAAKTAAEVLAAFDME